MYDEFTMEESDSQKEEKKIIINKIKRDIYCKVVNKDILHKDVY